MTGTITKKLLIGTSAAALALSMAACGSDGKPKAASLSKEYCDGVAHFVDSTPDTESASPEEITAGYESFKSEQQSTTDILKAQAPSKAKADVDALISFVDNTIKSGKEDLPSGTKVYGALVEHSADGCGWATQSVSAKDFQFDGVPKKLKAGTYAVSFANKGKEEHVFVLARVKDGVTKSLDDILAEETGDGPPADVEDAGATYAPGGGSSAGVIDLTKPGRYIFVCPIPGSNGQPHFTLGMKGEITVE